MDALRTVADDRPMYRVACQTGVQPFAFAKHWQPHLRSYQRGFSHINSPYYCYEFFSE